MNKNTEKYLNDLIIKTIKNEVVYIENNVYEKDQKVLNELIKLGHISINPVLSQDVIPKGVSATQKKKIIENAINNPILYHKIILDPDIAHKMGIKRLNNKNIKGGHDQIIFSLINFLKKNEDFLFFSNFEIKTKFGISRPDLYVMPNKDDISEIIPICYEIKHSHNDFMSDVKQPNKRASYLEISPQLYYVCPCGVIKPEELPQEAGLIYMDNNGHFEIIINAPVNKGWKENFNISLFNTLIRHKSNENIDFFISEKATINNTIEYGDFNSLCSNGDLILLSKNNIHILDRFSMYPSAKTFRELSLLTESYGAVYDLLGLGILKISHKKAWIYGDNSECNVFELTELGKKLTTELKKANAEKINNFNINERLIHKKFSFNKIKYKGKKLFDFYIMNKDKNMEKLLLTGFIKVKNKEDLTSVLNDKNKMELLEGFCQKLAFVNFENNIAKNEVPSEYSLFQKDKYYFTSDKYPRKEVKRGKKRNIENVNENIFLYLLKEEYFNRQCFIF